MFSSLQNLSKNRRNKNEFDKAMKEAKEHVKFCVEVYRIKMEAGRYFRQGNAWDIEVDDRRGRGYHHM